MNETALPRIGARRLRLGGLCALVGLLLLACSRPETAPLAPEHTFVLLPDRDGHVGSVIITTQGGSATLDQANQGLVLADGTAAPGAPERMTPARIRHDFGAALAAEPPASYHCILYFRTASSDLEPGALQQLAQVLKQIRGRTVCDVSVTGHTDTTGDPDYNMRLSMARASQVRAYLIQNGVPPATLSLAYHGKGNPLVPTGDNVDEPRNRRVEVIVR
jgi:outer membrane protein OmpA-like peptidoglycan-associated protein